MFRSTVDVFADSLPLFRHVFPNRQSYKQESSVEELVGLSYYAYNAIHDVRSMQALHRKCCIQKSLFTA